MPTLHALLYAIDDYPNPAHRLAGCRNDLAAIDAYLEKYCAARGIAYRKLVRTDGELTRRGFREGFAHFEAARDGDLAVFFYGGHGSRVPAPRQFWSVDPDRYLETIVCHDSRQPGGRDLTDKEVSYLIAEATEGRDLHFVALFDCCHSGTMTRNLAARERRIEPATRAPAFGSLLGADAYPAGEASGQRRPRVGRHIALSASRSYQTAKELTLRGKKRGIFTTSLIEALEEAGASPLSYQTLRQRVARKVVDRVENQNPQVDAYGDFDPGTPWLGTRPSPGAAVAAYDEDRGWTVPFGHIHHLDPDGTVRLQAEAGQVREAAPDSVGPDHTVLEGMRWADRNKTYPVLSYSPTVPRVAVALSPALLSRGGGEAQRIRRAPWPDQVIDLKDMASQAEYWIDLDPERGLILTRPHESRPLFKPPEIPEGGTWDAVLPAFVQQVAQVATWQRHLAWSNPRSELDPERQLDIQFERLEGEAGPEALNPGQTAHFHYAQRDGQWLEPAFRLRIGNATDRPLWVGALFFSEDFGITDTFFPLREIGPQDAPHPFAITDADSGSSDETIHLVLPDAIQTWGQTRIFNRIKIVVSEAELDLQGFRQEPLELEARSRGWLELLFGRRPEPTPDWATLDLDLEIHRPLPAQALEGGQPTSLRELTLEAPAGFRAEQVRLGRSTEGARSLAHPPPAAFGDGIHTAPFDLGGTRNWGDTLDMIEMQGVEGPEVVGPEHPLTMRLPRPLPHDRTVLPLAYDPEDGFFMPLGYTEGDGTIRLEALPGPEPAGERGFGRSLKIYLQQFIHSTFQKKKPAPYPILAAADGDEESAMVYEDDPDTLRSRVAAAKRILVLVHGLVGDTSDKRNILHRAQRVRNGQTEDLGRVYDLLLCYDYESLGTPIEDNARGLRRKLEALGLEPGHDKTLVLVAHSMGGLVSRWFIEREGGHQMVSCFVQVGSPNLGSPWARVYDWTTFALGKAMNFLPIPGILNEILGVAGKLREGIEETSLQMLPDSLFLRNLNAYPFDPGIPYYLIGGDSEKLEDPDERQRKFLKKFLARFQGAYRDRLEKWLFRGGHDDIVGLDSIYGAPDFPSGSVTRVGPVGCHHFSYFIEPAAVEALGEVLFRVGTAEEA